MDSCKTVCPSEGLTCQVLALCLTLQVALLFEQMVETNQIGLMLVVERPVVKGQGQRLDTLVNLRLYLKGRAWFDFHHQTLQKQTEEGVSQAPQDMVIIFVPVLWFE